MTGYLQRLFNRGGGDVPAPAAPSMSPVAQADQRLTVPGIGDALMWQPPAFGTEPDWGADALSPDATPAPTPPRTLDTPPTRPPLSARGPVEPAPPAPEMARERDRAGGPPEQSPQPPSPAIPSPIRRVGAIEAGDLELPADSASPPAARAPAREAPAEAEPARPAPVPMASPPPSQAKPEAEPVPARSASDSETRPPATPVEPRAAERQSDSPANEAAAEPQAPRLAEPAPPAPVLAMPVPSPEPPPLEAPAPPQAAPNPPAPRPEPRRAETLRAPEPARPPRPLTANEVSLIGPLPASRRSATMFGLRRR